MNEEGKIYTLIKTSITFLGAVIGDKLEMISPIIKEKSLPITDV